VADSTFLGEFSQYLKDAEPVEASESNVAFLNPLVDEAVVASAIEELERLKANFEVEIAVLNDCMKLLNKASRGFVKALRGKIKAVREEFESEIQKAEETAARKVNRLNEEYEEQRVKLMKDFEKQILALQKEKLKLEKTRDETLRKIEQYNFEAKACAAKGDSAGEKRWKEKANEAKKELSELDRKIEEMEEKIKELEENRETEAFKLRSEWETLTANIIQQIGNFIKVREADLANFSNLGFPQTLRHLRLVYMPFYMVCFEAELKKRYVVFSPSAANSVGFTAKLKGALGKTKVKHLLAPRFKTVNMLLEKVPALMEKNAAFSRELHEAGEKADILKSNSTRKLIIEGLKKIKDEGWLSEKEFETFSQKLG
jgi:hypothetical protein